MSNGHNWFYTVEVLEKRVLLSAAPTGADSSKALEEFDASPAMFVENRGQWDAEIRFAHKGDGAHVLVTESGPVFQLFREQRLVGPTPELRTHRLADLETISFSAGFVGANRVTPVGLERSETVFNYYVGDESAWRTNVSGFSSVAYTNLYDGIDLHTWGHKSNLKYEFHVAPGADWRQIAIRYDRIEGASIAEDGSLLVNVGPGWDALRDDAPYVYQEIDGRRVEVASAFAMVDEFTYRFEIGRHDAGRSLIIDPDLAWSTYVGGSSEDYANGIAMDGMGNALVTGPTQSINLSGANNTYKGDGDTFVAKVSAAGILVWATYLGGSGEDRGDDIVADGAGNALVTGITNSANFVGATNNNYGPSDAFVAKVSAAGTVVWATYVGGARYDAGIGITIDLAGNALVTGETNSTNFAGANNTYHGGFLDVFVAKVSAAGTLAWSTYLGGGSDDRSGGIAVDSAGDALVTGYTFSNDFGGANNPHYGGGFDGFVAKVSFAGTLLWATHIGGSNNDYGYGIAVDSADNALVTGHTVSHNFSGANNTYKGGGDAFVANVSAAGTLLSATYLGGSASDTGRAVTIDDAGNTLVTGRTDSANFVGANKTYYGGTFDAFVAKVSGAMVLRWATYVGGSSSDGGDGIAVDLMGNVLVVGYTTSTNFVGALNTYRGGTWDAFVAKISDIRAAPAVTASQFRVATLPQRLTFTFDANVAASLSLDDIVIRKLPGGAIVTPDGLSYDSVTNTATVTFAGILVDSRYRATLLAAGVTNPGGTPMAADHVFDFFFLTGDANHDARVNLADFNILAANFGQSPRDFTQGDFNYDGVVNLQDFNLLAGRFGAAVTAASRRAISGEQSADDEDSDVSAVLY